MYLSEIDKVDVALQVAPIALSFVPVVGWIGAAALLAANAARAASAVRKQAIAQAIQKRNIENAQKQMAYEQAQINASEKALLDMSAQRADLNSFSRAPSNSIYQSQQSGREKSNFGVLAPTLFIGVVLAATIIILNRR